MLKYRLQLIITLILILCINTSQAQSEFDKQRPQNVSDIQWNSLRAAVQETVLSPNASLAGVEKYFGLNVSIYGTTALIGAPGSTIGAPGEFFGTDSDYTGSVYVLEFDGEKWRNTIVLEADDGLAGDRFGSAVSLYEDWAVIGASGYDKFGTVQDSGGVYVFKKSIINAQTIWEQYDQISPAFTGDAFGNSVSIHDPGFGEELTFVVGAHKDGVNGSNSGSIYVYELDGSNWIQAHKFSAPDGAASDEFGFSVSIHYKTIAVGSPRDDDNGSSSGSVYIYRKSSVNFPWSYKTKLIADDASGADGFGSSVSVGSSARVLIGARVADSEDDSKQNVGSAYVFQEESGSWSQTAKLEADDQSVNDYFGTSVSLDGNRALIGAFGSNDGGLNSGSAYVFDYDGTNWAQTQKLNASDDASGDEFGAAVGINGDHLMIGAPKDDDDFNKAGAAYGYKYDGSNWVENSKIKAAFAIEKLHFSYDVSIDQNRALIGTRRSSGGIIYPGTAFVFDYVNGAWEYTARLLADDSENSDFFGISVSLLNDRAIIGATGVDSEFRTNTGAVYVFELEQGEWIQKTKLLPTNPSNNTNFGGNVELGSDRALISTSDEYVSVFNYDGNIWNETVLTQNDTNNPIFFGASISLDGDQLLIGAFKLNNGLGIEAGGVYVFEFDQGAWSQTELLRGLDTSAGNRFGNDVSLSGNKALIGAPYDEDNGSFSGSAYIFDKINGIWSQSSKLVASDASASSYFGLNVALDDNRALIDGNGSVYVFDLGINLWSETEIITHPDFDIGRSLDLHNNRALIGSFYGGDDFLTGSAYIYQIDPVYVVSGTITGLVNSIEIQNNGADNLIVSENGPFEFSTALDGVGYNVSVLNQPTAPNQNCTITNPIGMVSGENIINVQINCISSQFQLGVNVTGLAPNSSVQFSNGLDLLNVTVNGVSQFNGFYDNGSMYNVISSIEPTMPNQICTVSNGSGQIAGSNVVLDVECVTTQYAIGVTVMNMAVGNSINLSNNGEMLTVNNGVLTFFDTSIDDHSSYDVSIITQPSMPNQVCNVIDGTGQINGNNVTIAINCTYDQLTLSVSVTGLASGNNVTLNNNGDVLIIGNDSETFFGVTYDDGSEYNVMVQNQPTSPNQMCSVVDQMGVFSGSNINLSVICVTLKYTLGVNVSGLADNTTFIIQNNGDQLVIESNGITNFQTLYDDGILFLLSVMSQPTSPNQICTILNPNGTFNGSNVIVDIICSTESYFVGGTVSGLAQNSSLDLNISTNLGSIVVNSPTFVFPIPLVDNVNYEVSITMQPTDPVQDCNIVNASGTINGADVMDVMVICEASEFFIGLTVSGLISGNAITVQNNMTDDLNISEDGAYLFSSGIIDLSPYSVSISSPANNPIQQCSLLNASGNINGQDIDNVMVNCEASEELIFVHGFE